MSDLILKARRNRLSALAARAGQRLNHRRPSLSLAGTAPEADEVENIFAFTGSMPVASRAGAARAA
jgi:hypothetical protein